ncbi:MAG TPA: Hsp20/alpha crystallin family protein [Stellaceae bacterium]|nr:Hsp20/alpha crystallin family protein [Stellaceae bacterium]
MAITPVEVKKTPAASGTAPDTWRSFRSEMDRLFDRFSSGFGFPSVRRMFDLAPQFETTFSLAAPAVDVTEDDKTYTVTAELPGLDEKDIDVTVTGDMLVLKGEKRQEKEEKTKNRYVSERAYGSFQRSFTLPDGVDRDKITASFVKGVLTVALPKMADAQKQHKKIEVKPA